MSSAARVDNHLAKSFLVTFVLLSALWSYRNCACSKRRWKSCQRRCGRGSKGGKEGQLLANISLRLGILVILLSVAVNLLPLFLM